MNKKEMIRLAILGVMSGALISGQGVAQDEILDPVEEQLPVRLAASCGTCAGGLAERDSKQNNRMMMTEEELRNSLSKDGKELFSKLDQEGRNLAIKLAGEETYKKDPNQAVKMAYQKMMERRGTSK